MDEQAHEVPVEQELLLFLADRAERKEGVDRASDHRDEPRREAARRERARGQADAGLARGADERGGRGRNRLRRRGGRWLRLPEFLPAYDAVSSLANLLELLAPVVRPLSELVAELPKSTVVHRQVRCPWALKGTVMRVLTEQMKGKETDLLDGIKITEPHGWAQVVPDANEPLVHVYAEGETEEEATGSRASCAPSSRRSSQVRWKAIRGRAA